MGSLGELEVTLQQLQDFHHELGMKFAKSAALKDDCPQSVVIETKDVALLNKVGEVQMKCKPRRPSKSLLQQHASTSQAKYLLCSYAKSN